ncbi:hypothetical protein [Spirosoma utsteinense]|uniref:RiboL-PSP-HEPN domain-containing protein n=1 Tax=Spirosoma utsteinense TaxID=2585773 RepID=A0ABR6WC10_9BACT|nr:hypothetical protein [Spirosoma utsteinense]MBC3789374.1 hypothetical protein [Spirosoma utsteinense]MBC3794072.1 hypothetical protein [Spirosoma utsteinense]
MTTKTFIEKLNMTITVEGQTLMLDFFIIFSRFECALKTSNFSSGDADKVSANWDTFIASIRNTFNKEKNAQLRQAVDYLVQHPPRIQMINNGQLGWRDRNFNLNEPEINKLSLSIRDIRNNLFHGGKFSGHYQADISRNYILLKNAIIILNEWLSLNKQVRHNFLETIS